jgi:hypothetical protein
VVDGPLVSRLIALNGRMAGLMSQVDVPQPELYLRHSGPGFCQHKPPARLDARSKRILAWAHMSLRLVDWSIRHHGPADVDLWLDVAEIGVRRYV